MLHAKSIIITIAQAWFTFIEPDGRRTGCCVMMIAYVCVCMSVFLLVQDCLFVAIETSFQLLWRFAMIKPATCNYSCIVSRKLLQTRNCKPRRGTQNKQVSKQTNKQIYKQRSGTTFSLVVDVILAIA